MTLFLPLALAVAAGLGLSGLLIWLGRTARPPDPGLVLLRIPYRPWPGRYLRFVPPVGFLVLAVVFTGVLARVFWGVGGWRAGALVAIAGVPVALPLVAMAWTWRRFLGEPPSATGDALHIHGTEIPWTRVERLRFEEHGLVLEIPSARIFKRQSLLYRTYAIGADMGARIRDLHASARG